MRNKNVIFILIFLLVGIGLLFYFNILAIDYNYSEYSEETDSLNSQFKNGEKVANISNFKNMTDDEKYKQITNLSLSMGYDNITKVISVDGFEVWIIQNESSNPIDSMDIIVNISSGEVATHII
ncbi:hypothetical protein KQY27_06120 [Methanobrevibacter sp. TMH8]|uniref:hypothetical protein n=1 Tax=Methanobrevibacter sp. TMH8 TaxID=2848611 RepID=UPI001CCB0B34|nr:hypothetical protein [Methanobrevibacter sp. TMH8]MBZ9571113.1 hypothetical protein [Methanobrevibacter sp. TMH8]